MFVAEWKTNSQPSFPTSKIIVTATDFDISLDWTGEIITSNYQVAQCLPVGKGIEYYIVSFILVDTEVI